MEKESPKKDGIAALIVAKMKPKRAPSEEKDAANGLSDDLAMGMDSAMEDLLAAIEDKNPQAMGRALKDFLFVAQPDAHED